MTLRCLRNGLVVALFIGGAALAAQAAAPGDDSTAAVAKGEAVATFADGVGDVGERGYRGWGISLPEPPPAVRCCARIWKASTPS